MTDNKVFPILSIAGSDCSGGAGIQADIKTISAHGCYAMAAITSLTAQNTLGVSLVEGVSPRMVSEQIRMVYADIPPLAVKTGMLYGAETVKAVAETLAELGVKNLVVDPVMVSTSGSRLISEDAINNLVTLLFPLAELVTPNRMEAEVLTGLTDPFDQADRLIEMGCRNVLIKGGDNDNVDEKSDLLATWSGRRQMFTLPAIESKNTHGTGCTLSSAITSNLGRGQSLIEAIENGKRYVFDAIVSAKSMNIGHGHGPVNHFFGCNF